MLRQARRKLKQISPDWLNVKVDRNFVQNFAKALRPKPDPVPIHSVERGPHWRRITQVYTVLDSYWENHDGATYDTLIRHVKEVTGKGCSRKLISKWKRQRHLL